MNSTQTPPVRRETGHTHTNAKPALSKPGLKNTNPQIPVTTSNPGRNPSYPRSKPVSSPGFASFDRVCSSGKALDRDRSKTLNTDTQQEQQRTRRFPFPSRARD